MWGTFGRWNNGTERQKVKAMFRTGERFVWLGRGQDPQWLCNNSLGHAKGGWNVHLLVRFFLSHTFWGRNVFSIDILKYNGPKWWHWQAAMFQHILWNNFLYSQYFEHYTAMSWNPLSQNWLSICRGCLNGISTFDTWLVSLNALFHSNSKIHESMIQTIMLSHSLILHFFFLIGQVPKLFFYEDHSGSGVEMGETEVGETPGS